MAKKPQIEKFRDKAREIGADEDVDKFDAALRRVAIHKPEAKAIDNLTDMIGQADPPIRASAKNTELHWVARHLVATKVL